MGVLNAKRLLFWAAMAFISCWGGVLAEEARIPLVAGATDPEGDKLTCEWVQIGGPQARIDQPRQLKTFFVPSEPGKYVFEIRVSDGEYTVKEQITFVVKPPNQPPVASATGPDHLTVGEPVRLDGSASTDPDGQIQQYRWKQTAGPPLDLPESKLSAAQVEFSPKEAGNYAFELQVFDGKAWSASASVSFAVAPPNRKPLITLPTTSQEVEWPGEPQGKTHSTEPVGTASTVEPVRTNPPLADPTPPTPAGDGKMPVANAGKGATIQLGEDIVLDASSSYDPLGEELTYTWEQRLTDAPILHAIRHDPTSAKSGRGGPDHCPVWRCRPTEPGDYAFELVVTAGTNRQRKAVSTVVYRVEGKSASKEAPNHLPEVQVPDALSGKVGQELRIEAVVSDPENDPVDVTWTVLSPPELQLPGPVLTQRTLVFTPAKKGEYVFGVVAQDAHGRCEPKQVRVKVIGAAPVLTVKPPEVVEINPPVGQGTQGQPLETGGNHAPVAAIQPFGKPLEVALEGMLDGTLSSDEDGDRLTYRWRVLEGADRIELVGADRPHLTIVGLKPGAFKVELVVNDGKVDSAPALFDERVKGEEKPPAQPPVAKCVLVTQPPFLAGEPLVFSGAGSSDPERSPLQYRWTAVGDHALSLKIPENAGEQLTVTPTVAGEYTVELRVTNGAAESQAASVTFAVEEPKRKPVAVIAPVEACEPGGRIVLDGTPSQSVRKKSLSYRWECVDKPKDARVSFGWSGYKRPRVEIVLPKPGAYVFELKVSEDDEESDPVRVTVKTRAPNQAPKAAVVAVVGFQEEDLTGNVDLVRLPYVLYGETLEVEEGWSVLLDASGSVDPDGGPKPLTFRWKQVSSPAVQGHPEGARFRFQAPSEGTVVFDVVATDGKEESAPAHVTLNVLKSGTLPVAVPRAYVAAPSAPPPSMPPQRVVEIPAFKRTRTGPGDPVLILDAQMSTRAAHAKPDAGLGFIWKQIGGEDLQLQEEKLNKSRVGLLIYHPGRYRFMLRVNDGPHRSLPAVLDLIVKDPSLQDDDLLVRPERKAGGAEAPPQGKLEVKPEDEGALLPPPKESRTPVVTKEEVKPDSVAMLPAEPQGEMLLASADPAVREARQTDAGRPASEPAVASPFSMTDAIPGEITTRVRELLRKDYRENDPVFLRYRRRAESLALKPGLGAEDELLAMLREKDCDLRAAAGLALVQRGLGSVPGLIRLLEGHQEPGMAEVHWALQHLSHQSFPADAQLWKKWWSDLLSLNEP